MFKFSITLWNPKEGFITESHNGHDAPKAIAKMQLEHGGNGLFISSHLMFVEQEISKITNNKIITDNEKVSNTEE